MLEPAFRNRKAEQHLFRIRAITLSVFIIALMATLTWRMAFLQIDLHEKYHNLSENNRLQLRPIPPNRGLIYDRNGVLLAENIPSYNLTMVRERVLNMDQTIAFLTDLIQFNEREQEQLQQRLRQRRRPYEPFVIRHRMEEDDIAKILVNRFFLPGIDVEAHLIRHYPQGRSFAHALGYVGRINVSEQDRIDQDPDQKRRYSATRFIGKIGIERRYEDLLHGQVGYQRVETNARGRILQVVEQVNPVPGSDLTLYLDSRLQKVAEREMTHRRGAVVAIDVETGGILTLFSNPSFDPNLFVTGISHADYETLRDDPDQPLFDRSARGQYPPASLIKPFMGLALIDAGSIGWQDKFHDIGSFQLPNYDRVYRDWRREGHGMVDMDKAIIESCDTYFYEFSVRTGVDHIAPFLAQFGFGRDMTLDVISALPGILPDRTWKRHHRGSSWFAGDTVNMSIGQGFMLATPIQMATATAVLANRGRWNTPHLLMAENQQLIDIKKPDIPDITLKNSSDWDRMFAAMEGVISHPRGTGWRLRSNLEHPIASKTGTAQVVGIAQDAEYDSEALKERQRDHALFIAFAPVDNPKIAVAVIVENGEAAGRTAGPVAQRIINEYLGGAEG